MTILVTGGAGFIGSNFIHEWLAESDEPIVNLDKLTYAGNLQNLQAIAHLDRYRFVQGGIEDAALVRELLGTIRPRAIINFAAESHVDRSILDPETFIQTNVVGASRLLEASRRYFGQLTDEEQADFRFVHISTDEVYGTLAGGDAPFTESSSYEPSSPYAASKAASDHLVRAYAVTYELPTITSNCSNNYGPYQFPEKLIPLVIHKARSGEPLPLYGNGLNVRDWLYVTDHCSALRAILARGRTGETYNVGGSNEKSNIEVVRALCAILDRLRPRPDGRPHAEQIQHVKDRLGHDHRYAVDATKLSRELGWTPKESFETGIEKTVQWYLANEAWVRSVTSGAYRDWIAHQYG